ncbi:hypothetical protein FISHEDRAFT_69483 [Fistulina hepatica ATCC 64428]|uniref:F-box domain-containing protein n=1 Tax=Fistulina hepatica ATCC 64428 TaxID=1128425 RepID=A0A0D7A0Y8_9AGAR|nr:hypothetical protein FISHEDRAFT_78866 [Fistulina hepatica ATCC 64428]KIY52667.1 hypothetical protein FISHEDRAFT_69483 [Fistulina hepatica ATCC 64428]
MLRGDNTLPVDDDVISRIFTFLPDFDSLYATILTCRHLHSIFKAFPALFTHAVAENIVGPALPDALNALRSPLLEPPGVDFTPDWCPTFTGVTRIHPYEVCSLVKTAQEIDYLERLFSIKCKDRRTDLMKESKLSAIESLRFRRAMYRITFFSLVFYFDDPECYDSEEYDEWDLDAVRAARERCLRQWPVRELKEIHASMLFLHLLGRISLDGDDPAEFFDDIAIIHGPSLVLDAYRQRSASCIHDPLDDILSDIDMLLFADGFLEHPLSEILVSDPPNGDLLFGGVILDSVHGKEDACSWCSQTRGVALYGCSNLEMLRDVRRLSPYQLQSAFKGNLRRNCIEGIKIMDFFEDAHNRAHPLFPTDEADDPTDPAETDECFRYTKFIGSLFAIRSRELDIPEKSIGDQALCEDCVWQLVTDHIHLWWLQRMRDCGQVIPVENCRYGYECRTQTHKLAHATRLNVSDHPTSN